MSLLGSLHRYVAHNDPATGMANAVAMVVGWNVTRYPTYVIAIAGWHATLSATLTAMAAPFFLAIPALSRRSSRLARLALPLVGTANTLGASRCWAHPASSDCSFCRASSWLACSIDWASGSCH